MAPGLMPEFLLGLALKAIYLMLPAYAANMAPVLFRKRLGFLAFPLDFGLEFMGKPLLGPHKTFRGLAAGVAFAVAVAFAQRIFELSGLLESLAVLEYSGWLYIGLLMGFGAILGDSMKSFAKRRAGISPGRPWMPFDQLDFAFGSLLFLIAYRWVGVPVFIAALASSLVLHVLVNHAAFYIGVRREKW